MNILLFDQHELSGGRLCLPGNDRRALHIRNILDLKEGDSIRVGMINGGIGKGRILEVEGPNVEIEIFLEDDPRPERNLTLILALPRPIMLQRILKQATVLGVKTFYLIRSEKVQKSYFQSTALEPKNIRDLLLQGLEQAVDTRLPGVYIHQRFKPFVEDSVPRMHGGSLLLAHPEADQALPDVYRKGMLKNEITLAIGPEGGWNDFEVKLFRDKGFSCFSFGSRILHVDTAVLALLSQVIVLQDLVVGRCISDAALHRK